jgi:putative ubiquitin-RnfH superfamily antitoxin RatB of RatAB toxin-antitoxin module
VAREHKITVEVVFALAERQQLVTVAVVPGTTAIEAVDQSGIADQFPDQDLAACSLGIWGRLIEDGQLPQDGDRIEIYRPLVIDPRDARRQLALQGKSMGGSAHDAGRATDPA